MMRSSLFVPLVVIVLGGCPSKAETPVDRTIGIVLARKGDRCVVDLEDSHLKDPKNAVAYTNHRVIWQVVRNECGELRKITGKALGLKFLKLRDTGEQAAWFNSCRPLDLVPATGTVDFDCRIPSSGTGHWEGVYDYAIDGDSVDPGDPGIGVKRDG
jgi:hypothetical protein